jgi:hypothetical protein
MIYIKCYIRCLHVVVSLRFWLSPQCTFRIFQGRWDVRLYGCQLLAYSYTMHRIWFVSVLFGVFSSCSKAWRLTGESTARCDYSDQIWIWAECCAQQRDHRYQWVLLDLACPNLAVLVWLLLFESYVSVDTLELLSLIETLQRVDDLINLGCSP